MPVKIIHFAELTSTNDYAVNLIIKNDMSREIDDMAILADVQTAGRGRLNGRVWVSMVGNFHCSYIINIEKLGISPGESSIITDSAICSVRDMLIATTGDVDRISVKLPNDILINTHGGAEGLPSEGRKVAGVLVEVCYPFAVVGIGINLRNSPIIMAANIKDEFKILVKPRDLVDNLYEFLIAGISRDF
ncbi:MAG: hypothetical protein LBI20_02680 [Holosporales bacterium]|jgi:biotin-[acetyl-CoA-carboxylase] ligase BirA-like protein|nr:hypothetical protein [Holosporales bacterium]